MIELPNFLDVNVRKIRKCPRCGKRHYRRTLENTTITIMNDGKVENHYTTYDDAGYTWQCLECKLHIYQDGSWDKRT